MVVLGANALGVFEISISMSVGGDHGGWVGSFYQRDRGIGDGDTVFCTVLVPQRMPLGRGRRQRKRS